MAIDPLVLRGTHWLSSASMPTHKKEVQVQGLTASAAVQQKQGLGHATDAPIALQALALEAQAQNTGPYRIDLDSVSDKYIGDTAKNLDSVFAEESASGATLFFDEADALFGKRSDTDHSSDRYRDPPP